MPSKETITVEKDEINQFRLTEFAALKNEQNSRIDKRTDIINLNLLAAGTLFGAAVQFGEPSLLFLYTILSACLTATYVQNGRAIKLIGRYVRSEMETQKTGLGWQTYLIKNHPTKEYFIGKLGFVSTGGIFLITQILANCIAQVTATESDRLLSYGAWAALIFTLFTIGLWMYEEIDLDKKAALEIEISEKQEATLSKIITEGASSE